MGFGKQVFGWQYSSQDTGQVQKSDRCCYSPALAIAEDWVPRHGHGTLGRGAQVG
jgi:hypothetical protein